MNAMKGEAALKLADGREFKLVLDMEALVEAESRYGKPLAKLMVDASSGFIGASAALLQGAFSRHHDIARSEVLDMLRTDASAVTDALAAASAAAFPDAPSAEGKDRKKPPAGKTSGGNGAKSG